VKVRVRKNLKKPQTGKKNKKKNEKEFNDQGCPSRTTRGVWHTEKKSGSGMGGGKAEGGSSNHSRERETKEKITEEGTMSPKLIQKGKMSPAKTTAADDKGETKKTKKRTKKHLR